MNNCFGDLASNLITRGLTNGSHITKGFVEVCEYEIITPTKTRRGSGDQLWRDIEELKHETDPTLIKVYIDWKKRQKQYENITVEQLKTKIEVEVMKITDRKDIRVEIIKENDNEIM